MGVQDGTDTFGRQLLRPAVPRQSVGKMFFRQDDEKPFCAEPVRMGGNLRPVESLPKGTEDARKAESIGAGNGL